MRPFRFLAFLLWSLSLALVPGILSAAPTHIRASLIAESPVAPGGTVSLAIVMQPDQGWHGYWSNPGDAGLGMDAKWQLPPGATIGALKYPVPATLLVAGLMNHVYKSDYALLVPLTVPAGVRTGDRLTITADARWLACTDTICVPEQARLQTEVVIGPAKIDPRFDAWRTKLPAPLGSPARFALAGERVRIAIPLPDSVALHDPHLFVSEDKVADYAAVQTFSKEPDLLVVEIPRARFAPVTPEKISGVLRLSRDSDDGLAFSASPGVVPRSGMPLKTPTDLGRSSLPLLLLAALAGGLLLNVMPCVFPILSLKALSLARAGGSEAEARSDGLAYTAGVVLACVALGGLLLALRAGGSEVGWAFQLQEPLVVAALLLLAVAITANLLGFYEFAIPGFAGNANPKSAFATGLLAAFVATPCTGPFMAAAMGAALLLPVLSALLLFAALGLGIALPFLLIAYVPAFRGRLPRPGPWMARFKRWMALPMGLTALALIWLAGRLGGNAFWIACTVLAFVLLMLLVFGGWLQQQGKPARAPLALGIGVLMATAAIGLPLAVKTPGEAAPGILPTQAFSASALATARASGKPVFVWMTADWCLTCKVNEKVAIEREDVRDAFARNGVTVLRGDWTRRDAAITRYLTEQGAAGVPLYVWYPAGGRTAQQMPQVLTPSLLTNLAAAGTAK